ncbi:MAG TPA: hypothetical protein PLO14_10370 [Accumulibacter sp.]|uniref:hypothetical protein n=1 Tax=Accumulibacter sp. TaxID=2053492 RepID=UPI0025DB96B9|nr:hypothetical protein [Accumulibacter sp.]MCM8599022.1 hypothetical protein [Accumulibacter sp.]MCM8662616.1 hypothetical protein [Accumulibacter sp.]HNC52626.1 hypothetical protein [Accumulibacter sp.]
MNAPDNSSFADAGENLALPDLAETAFLREQVATIAAYVECFPSDERDRRALAWIEANAGHYRQAWQMRASSQCPLPVSAGN